MKKIKKFLIGNIKTVVAFILGLVIAGSGVYAAIAIQGSSVGYTDTNNIGATTVQGAIDKLGERANTWIDPSDFGIKINRTKTVMATPGGVCIKREGTVYCFGTNNWTYEKNHIQQVFSDVSCYVDSSEAHCYASDYYCFVYSNGNVWCYDGGTYDCYVYSNGSVRCN